MLVTVNNVLIGDRDITDESAHSGPGGIHVRQTEAARRLVIRELLRQRAEALDLLSGRSLDSAVDDLLEREIATPAIEEEVCQRYYAANAERFTAPALVEVRHILLAAAPDDIEARQREAARADALLATLRAAPERFGELARLHSRCPSRSDGGRLGWIGRCQTVPEFENVVLRLSEGLAERPVETRYGFHLVDITARNTPQPLAYEQARPLIAEYLQEQSRRHGVAEYLARLVAEAEIRGVDFDTERAGP